MPLQAYTLFNTFHILRSYSQSNVSGAVCFSGGSGSNAGWGGAAGYAGNGFDGVKASNGGCGNNGGGTGMLGGTSAGAGGGSNEPGAPLQEGITSISVAGNDVVAKAVALVDASVRGSAGASQTRAAGRSAACSSTMARNGGKLRVRRTPGC